MDNRREIRRPSISFLLFLWPVEATPARHGGKPAFAVAEIHGTSTGLIISGRCTSPVP